MFGRGRQISSPSSNSLILSRSKVVTRKTLGTEDQGKFVSILIKLLDILLASAVSVPAITEFSFMIEILRLMYVNFVNVMDSIAHET